MNILTFPTRFRTIVDISFSLLDVAPAIYFCGAVEDCKLIESLLLLSLLWTCWTYESRFNQPNSLKHWLNYSIHTNSKVPTSFEKLTCISVKRYFEEQLPNDCWKLLTAAYLATVPTTITNKSVYRYVCVPSNADAHWDCTGCHIHIHAHVTRSYPSYVSTVWMPICSVHSHIQSDRPSDRQTNIIINLPATQYTN